MALKISLKPGEKMIIGGAVVTNSDSKTELFIENKVPLLREKDILGENEAQTVAQKIYFTIQLMYIDQENLVHHHNTYWNYVKQISRSRPFVRSYNRSNQRKDCRESLLPGSKIVPPADCLREGDHEPCIVTL